jgi:hypothetical protein
MAFIFKGTINNGQRIIWNWGHKKIYSLCIKKDWTCSIPFSNKM